MFKSFKKHISTSQHGDIVEKIEKRFEIFFMSVKRYGGLVEQLEYSDATMSVNGEEFGKFLYNEKINFQTKLNHIKFDVPTQKQRKIVYYNSPVIQIKLKQQEGRYCAGTVFSGVLYKRDTCSLDMDDYLRAIITHLEASKQMERKIQFPECQMGIPKELELLVSREEILNYILAKESLKKKIRFNATKEVIRILPITPFSNEKKEVVYLFKDIREKQEVALGCMVDFVILARLSHAQVEEFRQQHSPPADQAQGNTVDQGQVSQAKL